MLGIGPIELTNLRFIPDESVQFKLEADKQVFDVAMWNNEKVDVIVKWKSTHWWFNVVPNYSIVKSKSTTTFKFTCRGASAGNTSPVARFSGIISAIKPTNSDAKNIWKNPDLQHQLLTGKLHKKIIFVEFEGYNKPNFWNFGLNGEPDPQKLFGLVPEIDPHDVLISGRQMIWLPSEPIRSENVE